MRAYSHRRMYEPLTPLEPKEGWKVLRKIFFWLVDHVGGLKDLAARGRISRALWRDLNLHVRAIEMLARQMLLYMQALPRIAPEPLPANGVCIPHSDPWRGDDPRTWNVTFRIWSSPRRAPAGARTRALPDPEASVCARRFAARLEALRRVLVSPGRAARRLARRLQRSDADRQTATFDDLAQAPRDPQPYDELFARAALMTRNIRQPCREAWARRRAYLDEKRRRTRDIAEHRTAE